MKQFLMKLVAIDAEIRGYIGKDCIKCSNTNATVVGDSDLMRVSAEIRLQPDMAANLASAFVSVPS